MLIFIKIKSQVYFASFKLVSYLQHSIVFITYKWAQQSIVIHRTWLGRLVRDKHSSLLSQFESSEKKSCENCPWCTKFSYLLLRLFKPSVLMLRFIRACGTMVSDYMLCRSTEYHNAEGRFAKCPYGECRQAEYQHTDCRGTVSTRGQCYKTLPRYFNPEKVGLNNMVNYCISETIFNLIRNYL